MIQIDKNNDSEKLDSKLEYFYKQNLLKDKWQETHKDSAKFWVSYFQIQTTITEEQANDLRHWIRRW